MSRQYRGQSGPHSIHDARQHAWAQLVFGPGAPRPRQRLHPGLLPDVYVPAGRRRPSLLRRLIRLLGGSRQDADASDGLDALSKAGVEHEASRPQADDRNDQLAA
jgi:hypothetical protein